MKGIELKNSQEVIREYIAKHCQDLFCEPIGLLKYKYIIPGSGYAGCLWDWDSWFVDMALSSISMDKDIREYEKGCILNFLEYTDERGVMPIYIMKDKFFPIYEGEKTNSHKPILAQHTLFICKKYDDYEWIKDRFEIYERYLSYYENNCKHESGLFYWIDDLAIGVDNDPSTFYRPRCSSASILLNCLMYMEYSAMAELARKLSKANFDKYIKKAEELKAAIQENCWDERDGFYYSVDINLRSIDKTQRLHSGAPRHYNNIIQRIGCWSGFFALYAGIADDRQAKRIVKEHLLNKKTFYSNYGIRSLSKMEKMYVVQSSSNPSCWLGPVWILCNYICFKGLVRYGYKKQAKELVKKTIIMLGRDIEENGQMHEYYDPETGKKAHNSGFQSWNLFVVEMINWINKA